MLALDVASASELQRGREAPSLVWWLQGEERQNFGDYLTDFLWSHLGGQMRIRGDSYRLIGSVIADWLIRDDLTRVGKWDGGRIVFWGCGLRDDAPLSPDSIARSVFCGVRGPLSRAVLNLPASTPIGDPALLLPLLHKPVPQKRTKGKTVCAPHFHDTETDERLLESTGVDVIVRAAVANSPQALTQILNEIASTDFVLAGSLHAAIVACAYGVPFCYFDSGHLDVPFKWRDFSASVNIGTFFVNNLADARVVYETAIRPKLRKPPLFPILATAPFRAPAAQLLKAAQYDAEQLGARNPIDVAAFSAFVDMVDRDVFLIGGDLLQLAMAKAEENLRLETHAHAETRQKLEVSNAALEVANAKIQAMTIRQNSWRGLLRMAQRRARGREN